MILNDTEWRRVCDERDTPSIFHVKSIPNERIEIRQLQKSYDQIKKNKNEWYTMKKRILKMIICPERVGQNTLSQGK